MDFALELVTLPVSDVDRAKDFYERCGFTLDVDWANGDDFRVVQFTPPGSACSFGFGTGLGTTPTAPLRGLYLVVRDVVAARDHLTARGVEVDEVRHMGAEGWTAGPDPQHAKYNTFAEFRDPDGNAWLLQEVP